MELEEILRSVDKQRRQNLVIGILVVVLLAFLAFIKDRDLEKRVSSLEEFRKLEIEYHKLDLKE